MSSRNGKRGRLLSDDERILWTAVTESIAPLSAPQEAIKDTDDDTVVERKATPRSAAPKPKRAKSAFAPAAAAPRPSMPPPPTPLGRRMKQRVARGQQTIDARLDLHGLTQAQAHAALLRFLRSARAKGARLVLVITGKGSRNLGRSHENERGVLRRQVPQWFGMPEFRDLVVGFEDAHISHGGEGALYVRVRRG